MPYARFENFGRQGGYAPDPYETGLAPGQWAEMYNADVYNGDLYSCGAEPRVAEECPVTIKYSFVYSDGVELFYMASDGFSVYAGQPGGSWALLISGLTGGLITWTVFHGTLVINSLTDGPYYWDGSWGLNYNPGGPPGDPNWDTGVDVDWDTGEDNTWNAVVYGQGAELPGWPAGVTCVQVIAYGYHLVALGVSDPTGAEASANYLVWWSDAAAPGQIPQTWTPSADNLAGDLFLQDTQGVIRGGELLRDWLIVYKTDSIYRLFFTFDPSSVISSEKLLVFQGVDTPYAIAAFENRHYLATVAGIFVFDGQSIATIDLDRVHGGVISLTREGTLDRVLAVPNTTYSEIWFAYRPEPDVRFGVLLKYNIPYDTFTVHIYEEGFTSLAQGAYVADSVQGVNDTWDDGSTYSWDSSVVDNPWNLTTYGDLVERMFIAKDRAVHMYEPITNSLSVGARKTTLVRYGIQLSDPTRKMILRNVYPEMEGTGVSISLGWAQAPYALASRIPYRWHGPRSFVPGVQLKLPYRDIASLFAIKVESKEDRTGWRLHALGYEFDPVGVRG